MIDDNKIEEAIEDYVRYSSVEDEYPGTEGDAFKAGVEWAINEFLKDLWHPESEEPEKFRKILFTGGSLDTTDTTMLITDNTWSTKVDLLEIKKWLYIEDLFSKKGGE